MATSPRQTCRVGRVQAEVAGGEDRWAGDAAAADESSQPGDEDGEGERLDEVVVGAEVEGVDLVVLAVLGAQHHHRVSRRSAARNCTAHVVAVQPRKHDVEDHGVVRSR